MSFIKENKHTFTIEGRVFDVPARALYLCRNVPTFIPGIKAIREASRGIDEKCISLKAAKELADEIKAMSNESFDALFGKQDKNEELEELRAKLNTAFSMLRDAQELFRDALFQLNELNRVMNEPLDAHCVETDDEEEED